MSDYVEIEKETITNSKIKYTFTVNHDLTLTRTINGKNWDIIDFRSNIGYSSDETNTLIKTEKLTSVNLKIINNQLIMETNLGNYVACDSLDDFGGSWLPYEETLED
jgi:hypothetical protein